MTTTNTSRPSARPASHGAHAEPMNMHTDVVAGGGPRNQPMNMHTDVVVTRSAGKVTITGHTDQLGTVDVQLPAEVSAALKRTIMPVRATRAAQADLGTSQVSCVFGADADVTHRSSRALTISGAAHVGGSAASVVLRISARALTTLRTQRDVL